jgi:hypothetical protein
MRLLAGQFRSGAPMAGVVRVRSISTVALALALFLCPTLSTAQDVDQPPSSTDRDLLNRAYRELAIGLERRAESGKSQPDLDTGSLFAGSVALPPPLDVEAASPDRLLFDIRPLGPLQAFTAPAAPAPPSDGPALAIPLPPAVPEAVVPPAVAEAPEQIPNVVPLPPERPDERAMASEESSVSSPEATSAVKPPEKAHPRSTSRRREAHRPTPKPQAERAGTTTAPSPSPPPSAAAASPAGDSAMQRASRSFTNALTCLFTPGCAAQNQARENATGAVPQPQPDPRPVRK